MDAAPRPAPPDSNLPPLDRLRAIVAALRGPGGCPWDREQTHATLRGALLEEAYEAVAAIDATDDVNLCEELGDVLLQVVFHAQLAGEERRFTFDDVARGIGEKLVRRHPHVFGAENAADSAAVLRRWDEIKRAEKGPGAVEAGSALDGLPVGLPALMHAEKAQKKAAKVGFDWEDAAPVFSKVREELAEVAEAVEGGDRDRLEDEIGDLLFSAVNLARKLGVDAEIALRRATRKFTQRFQALEQAARGRGLHLPAMSLAEMDAIWDEVKRGVASRKSDDPS